MTNITLSLQDDVVKSARAYAEKHNTSLNALIRTLLQKTINVDKSKQSFKILELSQKIQGDSCGKTWSRNDIYDV